jgi:hypothetical protein
LLYDTERLVLDQGETEVIDNWKALDRIEQAERETPLCICGQPTSAAARPDGIWLECVSLRTPDVSRIGRLRSALTAGSHARQLIIEQVADAA